MGSDDAIHQERSALGGLTRRNAIKRGLILGASVMAYPIKGGLSAQTGDDGSASPGSAAAEASRSATVHFTVNGRRAEASFESRVSLLDLLREHSSLPGTKKGCDHGQCGACTVLINGRRVLSCLTLAATLEGRDVTTIEGLAHGDELHPVQAAFLAHDGFQCGFCTPGQIMSAVGFLQEPWPRTTEAIREGMSGNLCRCGAYCGIVAAVQEARGA